MWGAAELVGSQELCGRRSNWKRYFAFDWSTHNRELYVFHPQEPSSQLRGDQFICSPRHIFCDSLWYFAHLHLSAYSMEPPPISLGACSSNWPMQGPRTKDQGPWQQGAGPASLAVDNGPQRSAFIIEAYETFDWRSQPNERNASPQIQGQI